MSLLDDVLREVGGASGGAADPSQHSLATDLLGMLSGGGMSRGLGGLVDMFNQKGLGDVVQLVGVDGAEPPDLGRPDPVRPRERAGPGSRGQGGHRRHPRESAVIAEILPQLVDRATPNGQMPAGGILDAISGFFKT